jgi:hypothetical protein
MGDGHRPDQAVVPSRDRRIGRNSDTVPLNRDREGTIYPAVAIVVEEGSIDRFANAVGETGFFPPTWLTVPEIAAGLAPALADEGLGIDLSRVLHGEEELEWRRALRVGEAVHAQTRIEAIRGRGDVEFLTLRTSMMDDEGEEVAVTKSVLIVRSGGA